MKYLALLFVFCNLISHGQNKDNYIPGTMITVNGSIAFDDSTTNFNSLVILLYSGGEMIKNNPTIKSNTYSFSICSNQIVDSSFSILSYIKGRKSVLYQDSIVFRFLENKQYDIVLHLIPWEKRKPLVINRCGTSEYSKMLEDMQSDYENNFSYVNCDGTVKPYRKLTDFDKSTGDWHKIKN